MSNKASILLTLVLASLFLVSLGIAHNAFADQVVATIQVGGYPNDVAVNQNTNMVYVVDPGSNMTVIDGSTNNIVTHVKVAGNLVAVNPVTNMIYVAFSRSLYVINGSTNQFVASIGLTQDADDLKVNPVTNKVYVAEWDWCSTPPCGSLEVINATSNIKSMTMPMNVSPRPGLSIDALTNKVYVSGGSTFVVDGTTDTITSTIGTSNAFFTAVNPSTNRLYAPYNSYGTMAIVNLTDNNILNTVPVGSGPDHVDVNPGTNKVYVGLDTTSGNIIAVIDGSTNNVIQDLLINTSTLPVSIAVNPNTNRIYVTQIQSGAITVIDGSSSGTSSTATVPSVPQNLQVTTGNSQVILSWTVPSSNGDSPITNYKIYRGTSSGSETLLATAGNVTSYTDNTVTNGQTYFYKVTTVNSVGESSQSNEASATPTVTNTIPMGNQVPFAIGINPNTDRVYVSSDLFSFSSPSFYGSNNKVFVIDGATEKIIGNVTVGDFPIGVAVNLDMNKIYVSNNGDGTVSVIDGSTSRVVNTITSINTPGGIAINQATGMIYVADLFHESQVYVIDNVTNTVVKTIPVGSSSSSNPTAIGVNSNTGMIYVTIPSDNVVAVIDGSTNTVVKTIPVGIYPKSVDVNPLTNKIYVANQGSCTHYYCPGPSDIGTTVSVIDGSTNTVTNTIQVGHSPSGVTVNPSTNKIYVTNDFDNTVSVIDGMTNNVTSTIQVGSQPVAVGVNPNTGKIYVSNSGGCCPPGPSSVTVIQSSSSNTSTVPSAPQNLVATAGNAQVSLSWSMPSSNGGSAITNYNVYRGTSSGSETLFGMIGNVTSYNDTRVANGQQYFYKVTAVNSIGESVPSNEANATPAAPATPSAPHNLEAHSGNGQVTLTWEAPTNQGISAITNYKIYRGTSSGSESLLATVGNAYLYTDNAVTNGQTYFYKVTAVNSAGESPPSDESGNMPRSAPMPGAPTNLAATTGNGQISLSWGAPSSDGGSAITNYEISRGTSSDTELPLASVSADTTTYTDTSVANGVTYYYYVSALNSAGWSGASNETSATPAALATVSSAPTGLTATTASSSQINLSWTATANNGGSPVTGYMIQRSTDSGATWSTIVSNSGSTSTTYSDTGLAASTTYTYQVSAINSVGTSSPSNTASATTSGITIASGIVLNNVQSTSGTTSSLNQVTLSGFNARTGSNQLLLVGINANNNSPVSVTFNGVQLMQAVGSFYNNDAEFWYLKNPTGTGDITVTMGGPTQAVVGAYSFSGVNQTAPIATHVAKHNTTPNNPNITITTKYPNDMVLDLPSIYGGSTLGLPTCTQQWDLNMPNAITGASSSTMVPSPATVTCKWTASSADFWDDIAVELRAN